MTGRAHETLAPGQQIGAPAVALSNASFRRADERSELGMRPRPCGTAPNPAGRLSEAVAAAVALLASGSGGHPWRRHSCVPPWGLGGHRWMHHPYGWDPGWEMKRPRRRRRRTAGPAEQEAASGGALVAEAICGSRSCGRPFGTTSAGAEKPSFGTGTACTTDDAARLTLLNGVAEGLPLLPLSDEGRRGRAPPRPWRSVRAAPGQAGPDLKSRHLDQAPEHIDAGVALVEGDAELGAFHHGGEIRRPRPRNA